MTEQKQYTFDEHDQLSRKQFAEFLLHLMKNHNDYRRDPDDSGSYTIAIDGIYGSGKTRFLQMFQSYLCEMQAGYSILYYDAWEHDIFNDALSSFVYQISHDDMFVDAQENEELEQRKESLHNIAKIALNAIAAAGAKKILGGAGEEVIDQIRDTLAGKITTDCENKSLMSSTPYEVRRDALNKLTDALAAYTSTYPLLIIIDELDRCAPDFAVQTFEIAKHLLSVPNAVFLFTVDMKQILAAVHKVYGDNIDAEGYICKVFDYIAILPQQSKAGYITRILNSWNDQVLTKSKELVEHIVQTLDRPTCSLRMINTILQAYHIMWQLFLRDYQNQQAYCLYFSCLCLKYQNVNLYKLLTLSAEIDSSQKDAIRDLGNRHETIKNLLLNYKVRIGSDRKAVYTETEKKSGQVYTNISVHSNSHNSLDITEIGYPSITTQNAFSTRESFHMLLYFNDLLHYEEIKHLTYGQYIHRQLEMFNFSYPDETEPAQE